jgi:protein-S-isoprenylcysteine O-methyltransferase Ste14
MSQLAPLGREQHESVLRRLAAIAGSALFLVIAPGFVAGLVPWWISHWRLEHPYFDFDVEPPFVGTLLFRFAGGLLVVVGSIGLLDCFVRFAVQGLGTPAPVFPTRHLVVTGLYRYVRNPMYVAVLSTILGQALLFGRFGLIAYGSFVWLMFHLFVLYHEEPTLEATFGSEYRSYRAEVPCWIPRLTPVRK